MAAGILASSRAIADAAQEEGDRLEKAMLATAEGKALTEHMTLVRQMREDIKDLETELREKITAVYQATGEKKPAPGLGVRVSVKRAVHYETLAAETWAKANSPAMLVLDTKAFEAWALENADRLPSGLVTIDEQEKITPTIAGDLSEYLTSDQAPETDEPPF
jgi:hypothetical protein